MKRSILINGLSIKYQQNGIGPLAIIFIHGNSQSGASFDKQLSDSELFPLHTLYALDLPGHGSSDSSKVYSLPFFADIITKFCQQLKLINPILVGHSLGGHIAIHTIEELSPSGVFAFGTPPLSIPPKIEEMFLANPSFSHLLTGTLSEENIKALAGECHEKSASQKDLQNTCQYIRATDTDFRSKISLSLQQGEFGDELNTVNSSTTPICLAHGTQDTLVNQAYFKYVKFDHLFNQRLNIINSAHSPHLDNSVDFNTLLRDFVKYVRTQETIKSDGAHPPTEGEDQSS